MKRISEALFVVLVALFCLSGCKKRSEGALRVYAIIHEEETRALLDLFTQKTGIKAVFMRSSTGELINRIIAEGANPQADVLLGGASSYHMQLDDKGLLESYKALGADKLPKYAKSSDNTWTGFCVLALGVGLNQKRYSQKFSNIPEPKSWDELLNKAYKGEIVMTNPKASSTAYLFLQNQLQRLGEKKGWEYITNLAELVGQFPDSGSAPAKLIGTGEYALCISYVHALAKYANEGFDVKVIPVPESVGDVDCISIIKGAKNIDASCKFVDFMLSAEAQELMAKISFATPVNPDAKLPEGCVEIDSLDLIDYDTVKASLNRADVLERWTRLVK